MTPQFRKLLLAGSSQPTGGGGSNDFVIAQNMGPYGQNYGSFPFVNLASARFNDFDYVGGSTGTTFDSNGYVATLGVGVGVITTIWGPLWGAAVGGNDYIKSGQYVIKWDGGAHTLTATNSDGITSGPTAAPTGAYPNRYLITLPQISAAGASFKLTWTNHSGTTVGRPSRISAFATSTMRQRWMPGRLRIPITRHFLEVA